MTYPNAPLLLAAEAGFNPMNLLLPALLIIMLFFMITRGRKAQQQAAERREQVQPGVYVMSNSGLFGTVKSRNDEDGTAVVEIALGTDVVMHLGALSPAPAEKSVEEKKEQETTDEKKPEDGSPRAEGLQ